MVHGTYFAQVKSSAESRGPWDHYQIVAATPADKALRPIEQAGCSLGEAEPARLK